MILNAVERGAGQAPPLVLLHGLFGRAANFGSLQQRLAARRRVIALDLRNHGASPHEPVMDYAVMAEDVRTTLSGREALPAIVLGHSMGGKVAMRLALDHSSDVAGLVVADIAPVAYPPHVRGHLAAMKSLPLTPGLTRSEADAVLAGAVPDPGVRGFLLQNLRTGASPAWTNGLREIDGAIAAIEDWPPANGIYGGPTLFIRGERSDYVTEDARPAIRALFPSARIVTLRGAGHWLHVDDPEGFLATAEGFLAAATARA